MLAFVVDFLIDLQGHSYDHQTQSGLAGADLDKQFVPLTNEWGRSILIERIRNWLVRIAGVFQPNLPRYVVCLARGKYSIIPIYKVSNVQAPGVIY